MVDMAIKAAPGEYIHPGYMISVRSHRPDGFAYATRIHNQAPWWAKWALLRWWRSRQPRIVGFAVNHAKPGEYVEIVTQGVVRGVWHG